MTKKTQKSKRKNFDQKLQIEEALTFDDILILPRRSQILPRDVRVGTRLTRSINLNIPLVSAAMDTVTESELAVALAREGGIGIIHKSMSIDLQTAQVVKVKRSESFTISQPITLPSRTTLAQALEVMARYNVSGIPIVDGDDLVGILTSRDIRFATDNSLPISNYMTGKGLITAPKGTSLEKAQKILHEKRIEKLPVIDNNGRLIGLITAKDILKAKQFPNSCKDEDGRLRVGAAVGVSEDTLERVAELKKAGVDLITVDSAHGHSEGVLKTVKSIKRKFPEIDVLAGNVATASGARDLVDAGADGVKVGIGAGAICTTRVIAGIGVPQVHAILDCAAELSDTDVPIVADGGIRYSGDMAKALAGGASSVMMGSLFAGTEESPGEVVLWEGRTYKVYYGMGSLRAMNKGSADRYFQEGAEREKFVPEGIEGRIPYKGRLADTIFQLMGGLRASMGYCGSATIEEFQRETRFVKVSSAGVRESHPHDVVITHEAPNYRTML
ncbi:IMP dehydrogenase [Calditrichota bacterium]